MDGFRPRVGSRLYQLGVRGIRKLLASRKAADLARADADERHLFAWIDFFQKTTLTDLGHAACLE